MSQSDYGKERDIFAASMHELQRKAAAFDKLEAISVDKTITLLKVGGQFVIADEWGRILGKSLHSRLEAVEAVEL